jgi:hypothetical protein
VLQSWDEPQATGDSFLQVLKSLLSCLCVLLPWPWLASIPSLSALIVALLLVSLAHFLRVLGLGVQALFPHCWGAAFWNWSGALGVGMRAVQWLGWQSFTQRTGPWRRILQLSVRKLSLPSPNISAHLEEK